MTDRIAVQDTFYLLIGAKLTGAKRCAEVEPDYLREKDDVRAVQLSLRRLGMALLPAATLFILTVF